MKCKQLLKFYFSAEGINRTLDGLITLKALKSAEIAGGCEECAEEIIKLIDAKMRLGELWRYLDGVLGGFTQRERAVLAYYGGLRTGIKNLSAERYREIKRVTVKFSRRAKCAERYGEGIKIVKEYYCVAGRDYTGFFLEEK